MSVNAINAALLKASSDIAAVESDVSTAQSDISTLQSAPAPGLVLISRTTIGNDVTSVTVSNAFSADYDHYRILMRSPSTTATVRTRIEMVLGPASSSNYSYILREYSYDWGPQEYFSNRNTTGWLFVGYATSTSASLWVDILNPYVADRTTATWVSSIADYYHFGGGFIDNTTSYTSFTVSVPSVGMFGGYIDVYGYAKA